MNKFFTILFFILVSFFVAQGVFAVSGACSSHNGVNCLMGRQLNGNVYCNDGWTDSMVDYDFMVMCKDYSYSCTAIERENIARKYGLESDRLKGLYNQMQDIVNKMGAMTDDISDLSKPFDYSTFYSLQRQHDALKNQFETGMKLIDAECRALGADRVFKQSYDKMQLDLYNAQIKSEQDELARLEQERQKLTENYLNALKDLNTCPANSTSNGSNCVCNNGYVANGNVCITYSQSCQNKYGANSYGDQQHCYCSTGYEFNTSQTTCIKSTTCPLNATRINNVCACNEGYIMRNNNCLTYTQDCIQGFGNNVIGVKGNNNNSSCDCVSGYAWNSQRTGCEIIKDTPNVIANIPIDIPTDNPTEDIKCADGLVLSPRKNVCIKVPENAHIVNSPTDLWLCNDGYKETGNKCVLIDNSNLQQNQNQEQVKANDNSQEPSKNIFKKIGNFFKSLFKRKK